MKSEEERERYVSISNSWGTQRKLTANAADAEPANENGIMGKKGGGGVFLDVEFTAMYFFSPLLRTYKLPEYK